MARKLGIALACALLTAALYAATNGAFNSSLQSPVVADASGTMSRDAQLAISAAVASDQPVESLSSELPAHDATVGKLAGSASTSGGAATYDIPIAVPPGRRGMQPSLSLNYSSRTGNGIAGMGWSLSGLSSLHRCPSTIEQDGKIAPVALTNADKLCLDGQRLVAKSGAYGQLGATYDTELESFVRVTQLGGDLQSASTYFKLETKSGDILWYGNDSSGRHPASVIPGGVNAPLSWTLVRKEDRLGNFMRYAYADYGNGELLLSDVAYTGFGTVDGDRHVKFAYQARPASATDNDQSSSYLAGGLTRQTQRLSVISTWTANNEKVREYRLYYGSTTSQSTRRSLLASVQECSFLGTQSACRPPTTFAWQQGPMQSAFHLATLSNGMSIVRPVPDFSGDGFHKVLTSDQHIVTLNADKTVRSVLDISDLVDPQQSTSLQGNDQYGDFDGDGKADVVGIDTNNHIVIYFWDGPANATSFAQAFTRQWTTAIPGMVAGVDAGDFLDAGILHVGDMNGDGRPDIVRYIEYPNNPDSCRAMLMVYTNVPNPSNPSLIGQFVASANPPCIGSTLWGSGSPTQRDFENILKIADLNGDGLMDIVLSRSDIASTGSAVPGRILYGSSTDASGFTSTSYSSLFAGGAALDEGSDKSLVLWPDINGDGLPDFAIARSSGWAIRMNTGHGLGPSINTGAHNGIQYCGGNSGGCSSTLYIPWFSSHIQLTDIDADGRQELLIPRRLISKVCAKYLDTNNAGGQEPYYACPEDPSTGVLSAPNITNYTVKGTYASGVGSQDGSAYGMNAVRFVETGPSQFAVTEETTSRVSGYVILTGTQQQVADVFGTGLEGSLTQFACQWSGTFACRLGESPGTLPDGEQAMATGTFVNENIGPNGQSNPDGLTPELPDLMSMATDGFGAQTVWTYYPLSSTAGRTAGQTPLYTIPSNPAQRYVDNENVYFSSTMPVVSDMSTSDGVGGYHSMRYSYGQAMYNQQGRGFQGFRTIIEEDLTAGLRTTTTFNQKFPLAGQVADVVVNALVRMGTSAPIKHEAYTWRCNRTNRNDATACAPPNGNATVKFPYLDKKETWTFDTHVALNPAGAPAQIGYTQDVNANDPSCAGTQFSIASGFDAYGNLTAHTVLSSDSGTGTIGLRAFVAMQCNRTLASYVAADTNAWWLDRLISTTTTSAIAYDGTNHAMPTGALNPAQTVTTSYLWNADRTLKQETVQPSVAKQQRITTYAYTNSPNYGLPTAVAVAADGDTNGTRSSGISYSSDGYFPILAVNALSQQTQTTISPRDGQPTLTVDANGLRTLMTYDVFGQRTRTQFHGTDDSVQALPDRNVVLSWCNTSCLPGPQALYKSTVEQDGTPTQIDAYDQLGRDILTASRNQDGTQPLTQTQYDALGHVAAQVAPYYYTRAQFATTFQYDPLGRVIQKSVPKGAEDGRGDLKTTYKYNGLQTAIQVCGTLDADASQCLNMTRTTDSMGRYMETVDAQGGVTLYWPDAQGHTLALQDAKASITTATYNAIGQRRSVSDPNQGTWSFTYDALGEMLTQTDARGIVTSTSYDKLSRPLSRSVSMDITGDNVADVILDSWSYDPLNGIGKTAVAKRNVNGQLERKQTYIYDTLARSVETDTAQLITGSQFKTYTETVAYDGYYGRPKSIGYPNGEAVATYYSKYGHPIRSFNPADGSVYREVTAIDARGNPTVAQLGGGLLTDTRTYRATSGELTDIVYTQGSAGVRRLDYHTDVFGNLTKQFLNITGTSETYTYDTLQRMTQATRSGGVNATVSYHYDAAGNFTNKTDFSTTGNAYVYTGGTCGGGPNAVKSIAMATGGTRTYCYDADGNLTSDSAGLSVKYDHDNLAYQTTRGASMINLAYGPDNQRTREWGSDGTKVFLDGGYEDWISAGSTKVYVGTEAEITKAGGTRTVNYLLTDRLGSVDSIADASGALIETRGSDAFGKPRSGTWADLSPARIQSMAITGHGFTGHEHLNSVELIHMNGRVYDYALGRFLSVDPFIQFPLNSQSLNPYSYILNNPLAGTDPSGYCETETTGSHICGVSGAGSETSAQSSYLPSHEAWGHEKEGSRDKNDNGAGGQGTGEAQRSQTPSNYDTRKFQNMGESSKTSSSSSQTSPDDGGGATTCALGSCPSSDQLQLGPIEYQLSMTASPEEINFIKGWEKWNGTLDKKLGKWVAKDDGYGNLTIGWGENCGKCEEFKNGITKQEGDTIFANKLREFEKGVNDLRSPMHQQQFDALLDFAYNTKRYSRSKLFSNVRSGITPVTEENFTAYGHAVDKRSGKMIEVSSLMLRRRREYETYVNGTYDSSH